MTRAASPAPTPSLLALLGGANVTLIALIVGRPALGRPTFAGGSAAWSGDDVALAGVWIGAVLAALWLAITTLALLVAVRRGRPGWARRIARLGPPILRRALPAALAGTSALVPAAAYAASPRGAPITVHVDGRGHITSEPRRPRPAEVPIVRTPGSQPAPLTTQPKPPKPIPTSTTTSTTTTTPATRPSPTRTTVPPTPAPVRLALPPPRKSPLVRRAHAHVVVPGDNLWVIARREVMRASSADQVDDARVARYWRRVIAANRDTLRSGDPSLIYPGEIVALP